MTCPRRIDPGTLRLVLRVELRDGEESQRLVERSREDLSLGGSQRPAPAPLRIRGELHRTLQKRRGRGEPTARLSPAGRPLQLACHVLVRSWRRKRQVPGATVWVSVGIGGVGQGEVHRPAILGGGPGVDGGSDERMPELHTHPDFDQLFGVRGRSRGCADPERVGRTPEQRHASGWIGGRGEQQSLGLLGQPVEPPPKVSLKLT